MPAVRGRAIPAWEPRSPKATGVTYASSPVGVDHTAGLILNPGLPEDQWAAESQLSQMINVICDSSGFRQVLQPSVNGIRLFCATMYGEEVTREQIADYDWQTLQDVWEFNRRAGGYKDEDDRLPEYMKTEGVGTAKDIVFEFPPEIIHRAKQRLGPWREAFFGLASWLGFSALVLLNGKGGPVAHPFSLWTLFLSRSR